MMMNIVRLANKFYYLAAQTASAQAGDIENALKAANLWEIASEVSALLSLAKVPDDASVTIKILVNKDLTIEFAVEINPDNANALKTLVGLLQRKYSKPMSEALKGAKLNVADTLTVNWLTF